MAVSETLPFEPSLQTIVYRQLLEAIITLDLPPGQRLIEERLSAQLGVSRVPVREALRQLEREQLVVIRPRRGAVVASLTRRDAEELYGLRIKLEGYAAFLAAGNTTDPEIRAMETTLTVCGREVESGDLAAVFRRGDEFHRQIVAATRNRKLITLLQTISHHVTRLRTIQTRSARIENVHAAHDMHGAIFDALGRRQAERAEQLMEEHIRVARDRVVPLLVVAQPELEGSIEAIDRTRVQVGDASP